MPFDGSNHDVAVTNPVTELLEQAWAMIDKPQKWTRGQPESVDGRRQCSLSALQTATLQAGGTPGDYCHIIALVILTRAVDMPGPAMPARIAAFNDSHTHAEVAIAFQRAIALSRGLNS